MAEEDTKEAVKEVEEPTTPEAPAEETEVEVDAPAEEKTDEAPEAEAEGDKKPTRKEKRQSRLADINKQLREENQELRQFDQPTPQQQQDRKRLSELLAGKSEVNPDELDQIADTWAKQNSSGVDVNNVETIVELKLAQDRAFNNARNEVEQVLAREEFNPDSDSYNPNLEKAVLKTWEKAAQVKYDENGKVTSFDPTVSLEDIANTFTDVAKEYANKQTAEQSATLSKQADESAVTGGTQKANSSTKFEDKSIEEMEAELGFVRR